jgi:hypothetical protein
MTTIDGQKQFSILPLTSENIIKLNRYLFVQKKSQIVLEHGIERYERLRKDQKFVNEISKLYFCKIYEIFLPEIVFKHIFYKFFKENQRIYFMIYEMKFYDHEDKTCNIYRLDKIIKYENFYLNCELSLIMQIEKPNFLNNYEDKLKFLNINDTNEFLDKHKYLKL